jgi:hypothetical protein
MQPELEQVDVVDNTLPTTVETEYPSYDIIDSDGTVLEKAEPAPLRPPIKLSRVMIGKIRKKQITVHNPRAQGCHHKLDLKSQPKHRNCEHCWWAWFQNNGEMVKTADEVFQNGHPELIVQLQGEVFYKNFLKFMSTVARLKDLEKPIEEAKEPNE